MDAIAAAEPQGNQRFSRLAKVLEDFCHGQLAPTFAVFGAITDAAVKARQPVGRGRPSCAVNASAASGST
jgi:hypothetical protein